MSHQVPERGAPGPGERLLVLVPALAFVVGLLLGAVLMWVARPDGGDGTVGESPQTPAGTEAPQGTAGPSGGDVVVPAACLRAGRGAGEMLELVRQGVRALGDLDTQRLQSIIDDLERLDAQVRTDVGDCRPQRLSPSPTG